MDIPSVKSKKNQKFSPCHQNQINQLDFLHIPTFRKNH